MKYLYGLILCLFVSAAFAQKDTTAYYLNNKARVVSTRDSADFIVEIMPPDTNVDKNLFVVKGYYPNGKLMFICGSRTNKLQSRPPSFLHIYEPFLQGKCINFFPNGHRMKICEYNNGNPVGDETDYYPNGKFYCTKTYNQNSRPAYHDCRDSTGKILAEGGNGKWLIFIDENFKDYFEGQVTDSVQEGEWHEIQNDSLHVIQNYKNGELRSSATIDKSGELTYGITDTPPEFTGGFDEFIKFLAHNIVYPPAARMRCIGLAGQWTLLGFKDN